MRLAGHNPDILTCLANLSADEVFTPPKLAVAMLDILPQDLFRRPDTTFLDPVCKSGVFLREIARRLNDGLKDQMPDPQARINHILTKQVFGGYEVPLPYRYSAMTMCVIFLVGIATLAFAPETRGQPLPEES